MSYELAMLRSCKTRFTKICMEDIEGLGGNAALLWIILCNKWDIAERNKHLSRNDKQWVAITRKTAELYGLKKNVFLSSLKKLESRDMILVERHPRRAARVKMRKIRVSTVPKTADVQGKSLSRKLPSGVPKTAQCCPENDPPGP